MYVNYEETGSSWLVIVNVENVMEKDKLNTAVIIKSLYKSNPGVWWYIVFKRM